MYFDGSFTLNGAGGGVILISHKGDQLLYVIWLHIHMTNNVVEYEALIKDLCITTKLGVQWLYIHCNSEIVINQVNGESNYCNSRIAAYRLEVRRLEEKFDGSELHHILWCDNKAADALVRLGSSREPPLVGVFMQDLFKPTIQLQRDIPALPPGASLGENSPVPMRGIPSGKGGMTPASKADLGTLARPVGLDWEPRGEVSAIIRLPSPDADSRKPISEYLQHRTISDDKIETQRLARQAKGYLIHNDELYCHNASGVL
jgi:ribonuclease HI